MSRIRDIANILSASTDMATDVEVTNAILAAVPSQSGNSGKYLTTNGSSTSWGVISSGTDGATVIAYSFLGMGA